MKISHLSPEQSALVTATRQRFFDAATSTVTDRSKAEAAVAIIVAPALVKYEIHWCANLAEAQSLSASLSDSLRASLSDSLWDSLWASLSASLWASLSASLWASLSASLWDSLRDSLWASLSASLWDSLRDSGWIAFYIFPQISGLATYEPALQSRLQAFVDFSESAFALWTIPGHVIILEKPQSVTVVDGKLVDISWEPQS
jgi:hypothetical protein